MSEQHRDTSNLASLEAIFDNAPDAIGVARGGVHVQVNPAYLKLFGFDRADEILGRGILELIDEAERPRVLAHIQQRAQSGDAPGDYTTLGLRKDGSTFDMDVRVSTFELRGESYSLVVLRDETESRRIARALSESSEQFRLISEQSLMGIAIIQNDEVAYINRAAAGITGYSTDELEGWSTRDFGQLIHPDDLAFALDQAERKQRGGPGAVAHYAYRLIAKTGAIKHVEQYSRTVTYRGAPANLVTTIDVSARQRAEEEKRHLEDQLLHLQKMDAMGSLAGGVAHDFNNLLTAISANAQLGLRDLDTGSRAHASLLGILEATERATKLTRQLLTFSRKQRMAPTIVDVNTLLESLRQMLTRVLGENVSLEMSLQPELGAVQIDAGQLEQALVNLSTNARDAMPDGGMLLMETARVDAVEHARPPQLRHAPGPYVRITVSDQGVGMSAATKARIFEPFFTTKAQAGGTGLGLSTTWAIVDQGGGWIDVASELGRGSRFSIFLPRCDGLSAEQRPQPTDDALPRGTESIWVVEDDFDVRETSTAILRALGYRVVSFASAGDALVAAGRASSEVDLLFTDIVMPLMDGCELADRMRNLKPSLKVLFNSGYAEKVISDRGVAIPGDAFLAKPYAPLALARRVRAILDD